MTDERIQELLAQDRAAFAAVREAGGLAFGSSPAWEQLLKELVDEILTPETLAKNAAARMARKKEQQAVANAQRQAPANRPKPRRTHPKCMK